ncbi:PREDICTED: zinc finger protein-like 1 homolog isoform X2 [Amphimedon queenslandica]|uniref:RING-type domain-containing protein n=1 Tax=Amphimedon queenslandica TaxID=400682 RepID=A0AAN0J9L5_AMPQE|nr:PREDICTED: zinc finger protein-like 1 homolog isoform X2 [Amphimedon queenslandica]|eukprot:XP_019853709.1 PREDICTED: zinc finger protein-like 1 homolog isoform X2 [Amphimedon queenslandica]
MGLCKCPKKRVTNLFCFVHRVNVCEDCMIRQHSRCIVHSYLQWLQDSDYESVCLLCAKSLDYGDVVRLCCHDLFHVSCLDGYVQSATGHSKSYLPSELKCPQCKDCLFPSSHVVSPIADQLRLILKNYWWGREGLGLETEMGEVTFEDDEILTTGGLSTALDNQVTSTPLSNFQTSRDNHVTLELFEQPLNRGAERHNPVPIPSSDYLDEDKYKRKNPIIGMKHWFRSQQFSKLSLDDSNVTVKRNLIIFLIVCMAVMTLIVFMTRVSSRRDPSQNLDWKINPNIRTGQ